MGAGAGKSAQRASSGNSCGRSPASIQWEDPSKIFRELDTSKDGKVSKDELTTALTSHGYDNEVATKILGELDTDLDGVVTFDEWRRCFYASSLVMSPLVPGEDFADLYDPADATREHVREHIL